MDGSPALPGGSLLPRLLRVLRHAPAATADGAPARTPRGRRGTAGALPMFTHMPVRRVGAQLSPGGIAARHRNAARGLERPNEKRAGETVASSNRDRAPQRPMAASFGADDGSRGFQHWFGFPTPFCLATAPGALAAHRCSIVEGRLPPAATPQAPVLPSSFSRPFRRPGARGLSPRPVIWRLVAQSRIRREPALPPSLLLVVRSRSVSAEASGLTGLVAQVAFVASTSGATSSRKRRT
jgi:hypothetical protein